MTVGDIESKFGRRGVVVDTNILVVYVTGLADPNLVGSTRKTKAYTPEDFRALDAVLGVFERRITFPNILTEASNLLEKGEPQLKFKVVQKLYEAFDWLVEQYKPAKELPFTEESYLLGVTDQVILTCVHQDFVLLSDDFELSNRYSALGGEALNFNHVREAVWSS